MAKVRPRSFASRILFAYVGAAVGLLFLIGSVSTVFAFEEYARTVNEVIASVARSVEPQLSNDRARHATLTSAAPQLIAHLSRPRIRIAIYDDHRRLVAESKKRQVPGLASAVASLMHLHNAEVPALGGLIVISPDLEQLERTLRAYWTLMFPTGLVAIVLAWLAGWMITRRAVAPLVQIAVAMRRFAAGDFRPVPIRSTGDDEIGDLAHSYNGALHQVRAAFAERDRTEAQIRQFIADAGHELRTPLTVIMGYLDVLEDGAADAPGVRERVFSTLRQESRRMRVLIEKLIYLARLERGEAGPREILDLSSVVLRVIDSFPPAQAAGRVTVSTARDAFVVADDADIVEVVRNLVDNALKHAPGSEVTVTTAVDESEAILVVRDHGPGMSDFDRAHAFDRFYRGRGRDEVEGSGLGLAIVKGAAQRSEATISLESRQGEGTTFTVRFPRANPAPESERRDGRTAPDVEAARP